jgi:thiamine biosynthesis lipoprotein
MAFISCLNLQITQNKNTDLTKTTLIIALFLLTSVSGPAQMHKFRFTETKMGSPFNLVLITDDSVKAAQIAREGFALVDFYNRIFSDYDSSSELSHINQNAGKSAIKLSPALFDILLRSANAWKKTNGAFDITVAPLSQIWRRARKEKKFPDAGLIKQAKTVVGFNKMILDTMAKTIFLPNRKMKLDLGGIAKGYTAEKVLAFLQSKGIAKALVDAGGDIAIGDAPANQNGWTIAVNVPESAEELLSKKLLLHNMSVATSGDAFQYFEKDGKKYSHIIDPRTGYGILSQRNVTIIASTGTDADWLATASSILPLNTVKKLCRSMQAEFLITEIRNHQIIYHQSDGFARYWKN